MDALEIIGSILLLISCIFIIAVVLMQDTQQGMSSRLQVARVIIIIRKILAEQRKLA